VLPRFRRWPICCKILSIWFSHGSHLAVDLGGAARRMGLLERLGLRRASPPSINALLQMISKRAERLDAHQQAETFVSLGGIENTLLNNENRIIFGRRGTGKTHVMAFVAGAARKKDEIALLIDLRTIGSGLTATSTRTNPSHCPSEQRACFAIFCLPSMIHCWTRLPHRTVVMTPIG
jgi:Cdc6-like AAA superfamily ATPase